jgi:hypothetical protein
MTWKLHSYYKMRDGKKAALVWVFQNGDLLFVREGDEWQVRLNSEGNYCPQNDFWEPSSLDIVSEWREPLRVTVEVYRHKRDDRLECWIEGFAMNHVAGLWDLIARKEIIEGEGME